LTLTASPIRPAVNALTPRQLQVYRLIVQYRADMGISPTQQEMADALGIGKVSIHEHVNALRTKGWLIGDSHKSRSLQPAVESLPPDEVLRSGVADIGARLGVIVEQMGKGSADYELFKTAKSIHSDLVALLKG
jgi:SOS-response transcriptional repressor LexA